MTELIKGKWLFDKLPDTAPDGVNFKILTAFKRKQYDFIAYLGV